MEKQFKQRNSC